MEQTDPVERLRAVIRGAEDMEEEERRSVLNQALAYASDVRDLYQAEKARADELEAAKRSLEVAAERMRGAERSREEFIANCSHELKTPLTPIIGWARILQSREVSQDEVREFAATIERQGRDLLRVVESLLRVASIQRNYERTAKPVQVDVARLLTNAAVAGRAAGRIVEIAVEPGAEWVMADESDLGEVLLHLVENALEFTPDGSRLELSARRMERELRLSVADHGPGVPEADRERIFGGFEQGDASSTREHGGLGIGLYVCREVVDAHGGRIWVEDTPGGGATFVCAIPQRRASDTA